MDPEESSPNSDTSKSLDDFFPGFTVRYIESDSKKNNYVVQHKDKKIVYALSIKLAEAELGITGNTGKPKFVYDHLQDDNYGIVLTDENYDQIISYQNLIRKRTDGRYVFMITSKELTTTLRASSSINFPPATGNLNPQGRTTILNEQTSMGRSASEHLHVPRPLNQRTVDFLL